MTTDLFQQVLFNDGEELEFGDLNDAQAKLKIALFEQLLQRTAPDLDNNDPQLTGTTADGMAQTVAFTPNPGQARFEVGSAHNKVKITAGTLLQKIAATDGATPSVLPFTFDGTLEATFANGDPSHPRIDLLQMQLQLVNGPTVSRAFAQLPAKASLDLHTVTVHDDTVVQAKVPGVGGDNISVAFAPGGSLAYAESGNAITITYVTGVTTVAAVEAQIAAHSTLIEIKTAGTPANVLVDPGDTFAATHLTAGSDELIVTQLMPVTRFVQATVSVKMGTPAASPTVPSPDAGFVPLCAMVLPTAWAWTADWTYDENAAFGGTTAVLYDMRMPLGVRAVTVDPGDYFYDSSDWTLDTASRAKITAGGGGTLMIPCPGGGQAGRIIGVLLPSWVPLGGTFTAVLAQHSTHPQGGFSQVTGSLNTMRLTPNPNTGDTLYDGIIDEDEIGASFEARGITFGSVVVQPSGEGLGPPMWTSGMRGPQKAVTSAAIGSRHFDRAAVFLSGVTSGVILGPTTFFIAEGL